MRNQDIWGNNSLTDDSTVPRAWNPQRLALHDEPTLPGEASKPQHVRLFSKISTRST